MQEEGELCGPFNSEEEMKKFMYLIGEELGAPTIKFISLSELSELIEKSSSVDGLQASIRDSSEEMQNLDSRDDKESLVSRLFNKSK